MNAEQVLRLTVRPIAPGSLALAILAAVATIAITAWSLRTLPPRRRLVLLALRTIGVACALVLFLQPALRHERRALRPSRVVVLLDDSASMALPLHGHDGPTRHARAVELADEAESLADVAAGRTVEIFALGAAREDAPIAVPKAALSAQTPSGPRTAIAEALTAIPRALDRDLAAVVLLSDGADHGRAGSDPALDGPTRDALQALDAPVHTFSLGDAQVRDAVVGRVAHDDFAFVRTAIDFDVPVSTLGSGWSGRVPLVLRRDGVVVDTRMIELKPGTQHVTLRHTPDRIGEFVFDIALPQQPGELTASNNVSRFSLRVVRDRVRVLQVCGRPSWDERFLRSLFKRDPNIDLISFFILRTPTSIEVASNDDLALIPFPTDELFHESLHTFDLVVLQNFDYGPYNMASYLPFIRRYVEEGGALAMLGGDLSFQGGGYGSTALEPILPVELDPDPKAKVFDAKPVSPRLTEVGRTHPLTALALDVEESARIFTTLPKLDGVNLVRRARPDAAVLAVHPTLFDADHHPLPIISVRDAGRGRVLAVGSDSTWRWAFEGDIHGANRPYERFWESAIRWLVRDPALSLLRIDLDRATLDAKGVLPIRVTAVGPDYRPVAGANLHFMLERVADPEGLGQRARAIPKAPESGDTDVAGVLERTLEGLPEGAYRLRVGATLGGRPVEDEKVFLVEGSASERADPAARPALLKTMAIATGGEARDGTQSMDGLQVRPPRDIRVAASEDRPLWTSPILLFLAVLAMCAAWALGRRWGRR